MSPQDADEQMFLSLNKDDEVAHMGGVQAALADGSVRFLSATMATETRRAIISINGNETVGEF
jgi:prepilin-type processing-associated H-X9-DG protein